jgi:hypothetical protein
MLLNEVILDIKPKLEKRKEERDAAAREKRSSERLAKMKARRKDKGTDELAAKRAQDPSKHAGEFRRIAKLFKKD